MSQSGRWKTRGNNQNRKFILVSAAERWEPEGMYSRLPKNSPRRLLKTQLSETHSKSGRLMLSPSWKAVNTLANHKASRCARCWRLIIHLSPDLVAGGSSKHLPHQDPHRRTPRKRSVTFRDQGECGHIPTKQVQKTIACRRVWMPRDTPVMDITARER